MDVGLSIDVLSRLGFKIEPAFDRAAYRLNYYGVRFELSMLDFRKCRSIPDLMQIVRFKYRNAGGSMRVQVVRVNGKKGQALCQQIEAWPGDYRWKCGSCLAWGAWVQPTLGALCAKRCGAMVVYVERRNLFDQQLIDQYEEGLAKQYFTWMDDGVRMAKVNTGADFSEMVKTTVDRAAMKEAADREEAEQARRTLEMDALNAKLSALAEKQQREARAREAELIQQMRQNQYEKIRQKMLEGYQLHGTMAIGIEPVPVIYPQPVPKKKKEKKPKPKPKIAGPRKFREDFNDD